MKTLILTTLLVLFTTLAHAGVTRNTYTNKSGSVVARSYTSQGVTIYKDNRGNTLGFSRETNMGGAPATRILAKDGTYKGLIVGGLIRDNTGKVQGAVKNTTPYTNNKGKK